MTLTFTQENGLYVAEFEATAPFSIHLERPKGGFINMLQRSVDSGTFVAVKNFNPNYNATQVIDADCGQGAVYPKWIRLESAVEPSVAEVTFESESSGGGAGESTITYYDVSGLDKTNMYVSLALKAAVSAKITTDYGTVIAPYAYATLLNIDLATLINNTLAIALDTAIIANDGNQDAQNTRDLFINILETGSITMPPEITKEQFYNLEA